MREKILNGLLVCCIFVLFLLTAYLMYKGAFAFWFDPARDLGLGLENLKKLSLIGHPSGGLAGVFYGPYYIWFISALELINKDPRWVWFAFATLPYFTLFPLGLFLFKKYSDTTTLLAFWLLFILSFSYPSQVWNPHPTPIFYLFALYFATRTVFTKKPSLLYALATGLFTGLIANFHMSFGSAIILSFFIVFATDIILALMAKTENKTDLIKGKVIGFIAYGIGVFVTYIPFLLFEMRHGFNQIKIIVNAFVLGITKGVSINIGHGYSKPEIIHYFFVQGEKLLRIPSMLILPLLVLSLGYIMYKSKKAKKSGLSGDEISLLALIGINAVAVLFVFLTTKNPVYDYFFTSVEMFFLIVALVVTKKIPVLKYLIIALTFYVFFMRINSEFKSAGNKGGSPDYASKRDTVDLIYKDAKKQQFTVYIFDPAIYTYDFDYIIGMYKDKYGYEPHRADAGDKTVYVILPENKDQGALDSFTTYHTPNGQYSTVQKWTMRDGTVVLKRQKTT